MNVKKATNGYKDQFSESPSTRAHYPNVKIPYMKNESIPRKDYQSESLECPYRIVLTFCGRIQIKTNSPSYLLHPEKHFFYF